MKEEEWVMRHPLISSSNNVDVMGNEALYIGEIKGICRRANKMNHGLIIDENNFFSLYGINMSYKEFLSFIDSLSIYEAFKLNHIFYAMQKRVLLVEVGKNRPKAEYIKYVILIDNIPTYNYSLVNDDTGKLCKFISRYQLSHIKLCTDLLSLYNYASANKQS